MPESPLCCIDTCRKLGLSKNHAKEPPMFIFLGKFSIVNWGSFSFFEKWRHKQQATMLA